jgi:hypothetical protein
MKLPSLHYLVNNAKASLLRFPLAIISSLVGVIISIYLTEKWDSITNALPFINLLLTAGIGIPLFFCSTIITERRALNTKQRSILYACTTILLVLIFLSFPNKHTTHNTSMPYIKYGIYNITAHLLVSFIPFIFSKEVNSFWHYNKILFIRFLLSVLYSGVIYIGLIMALSALHLLFEIKIKETLYFDIWIVTTGFFNTWFFVSEIPKSFDEFENNYNYPKGLKTFTQYVLLPLLTIYLIILYAYGSKILIGWNWPKGIVSYLIICVAILGILTFLLLYPYAQQKDNDWIKKVSKGYYFILTPLLFILFIAIFMRIDDYGITINRYIILVLGIWLVIVCAYTALGKTNIKFIPTSLAMIAILSSFGPWGMFSVSESSQTKRLENILTKAKILDKGKIQNETIWIKDSLPNLMSKNQLKNEEQLNDSLRNEIKSIIDYLDNHHGFSSIRSWYQQNLDSIVTVTDDKKNSFFSGKEAEIYMRSMGLKYEYVYDFDQVSKTSLDYNASYNSKIKKVTGFDYVIEFNQYNYNTIDEVIDKFEIENIAYTLQQKNTNSFDVTLHSKEMDIEIALNNTINNLKNEYGNKPSESIPFQKMQVSASNSKLDITLEIHSIGLETKNNKQKIRNINGLLFMKKK